MKRLPPGDGVAFQQGVPFDERDITKNDPWLEDLKKLGSQGTSTIRARSSDENAAW